jgi:hypothetical protein
LKIIIFLMSVALASEPDYVRVTEGDDAPISGILLTEEALAKIIAQNEREVEQCKIDAEYAFEEYKAQQTLQYDLLDVRYRSEIQMYQDMIAIRDDQIKKDKKRDVWQRWSTYGAFILGVGTTVGITYAVNQNFN